MLHFEVRDRRPADDSVVFRDIVFLYVCFLFGPPSWTATKFSGNGTHKLRTLYVRVFYFNVSIKS